MYSERFESTVMVLIALVTVLFLLAYIGLGIAEHFHVETKTITVESKEDVAGKDDHRMLVQTTDNEWYEVDDIWFRGVFNSRDTWGGMKVGKTYEITAQGWRLHFPTRYPKIYRVTEVKPTEEVK